MKPTATTTPWITNLLVGFAISVFGTGNGMLLAVLLKLNTSVNQNNVINEKINGKLEIIQVEIQSLKEFKTATERENRERDKTVVQLEQQVGILEEKTKVTKKTK